MQSLTTKLADAMSSELARTLLRTFFARTIAATGILLLLILVGQLYGPDGVGTLALGQSLLLGAGLLSSFGMNGTLMRVVGQYPSSPNAIRYLTWASKKSLIIALGTALSLWSLHAQLEKWFGMQGLGSVTVGMALAIPGFTLSIILAGFFKGTGKPATACLQENGAIALVATFAILIWTELKGHSEIEDIGYIYALSAWLVALQGCIQLYRWVRLHSLNRPGEGEKLNQAIEQKAQHNEIITKSRFSSISRDFFIQNLATFMQQVLSIMIAGWLLSASDLGLFRSAQQLASLIAFILLVINAVFPPRFAAMHHIGDQAKLGWLARQGALIGIVLCSPLLLICLFAPNWTLSWFGTGFGDAATMLRIIAIAQLVNVATGSVGFLLSMTGHERLFRNIVLICNGIGLLTFYAFIQLWGALGAAIALAFVLVIQNSTALLFVWKKLGIWTLPMPNILRWIGIKAEKMVKNCGTN